MIEFEELPERLQTAINVAAQALYHQTPQALLMEFEEYFIGHVIFGKNQIAIALNVTRSTLDRWIETTSLGEVVYKNEIGRWVVKERELNDWMLNRIDELPVTVDQVH